MTSDNFYETPVLCSYVFGSLKQVLLLILKIEGREEEVVIFCDVALLNDKIVS